MPKKNPKKTGGKSPFAKTIEKIKITGLPRRKERMKRIRKLESKGFDVKKFMKATVYDKKKRSEK